MIGKFIGKYYNRKLWDENQRLNDEVKSLRLNLISKLDSCLGHIEVLDPSKVYYIYVDGNYDEVVTVSEQIKLLCKKLKWTAPNILVLSKSLEMKEVKE